MKIYTKTGDRGTTSLVGGERVSKTHLRLEAYGTVDELSADVALLRDSMREEKGLDGRVTDELFWVLERLMVAEAELAAPEEHAVKVPQIAGADVRRLEEGIDRMQAGVPPVFRFTLPGGHRLVSLCHVCRTVCRRAERAAVRVYETEGLPDNVLLFLNRLSDYFYALGRKLTHDLQVEEQIWEPEKEK